MDYVLILYVCSVISGSCIETIPMPRAYKTHTECVINGSKKVTYFLERFNKKDVETAKLYVAYSCGKRETT